MGTSAEETEEHHAVSTHFHGLVAALWLQALRTVDHAYRVDLAAATDDAAWPRTVPGQVRSAGARSG